MAWSVKKVINKIEKTALHISRTWWRPVAQWSAAASIFVNGVYNPIILKQEVNLADLAMLIGAVATLVAIRGVEKKTNPEAEKECSDASAF